MAEEGLGMREVVGNYTGELIGPMYFQGQLPIDGLWATGDITIANACLMPTGYGIGNHRLFIIDFLTSFFIGTGPPWERRAASWGLNTRLPQVVAKYNKSLEANILRNRLIEKLGEAHLQGDRKEGIQCRINDCNQQSEQYMKHVAKTCRKIKSGRICFSPESVI